MNKTLENYLNKTFFPFMMDVYDFGMDSDSSDTKDGVFWRI